MIIESTRRMAKQEQEAYDLGFHEGKYSSIPKWTSVEKNKPSGVDVFYEDGECFYEPAEYIVKVAGAEMSTVAMFDGENFIPSNYEGFIEGRKFADKVTHWMPLPEPPQEE